MVLAIVWWRRHVDWSTMLGSERHPDDITTLSSLEATPPPLPRQSPAMTISHSHVPHQVEAGGSHHGKALRGERKGSVSQSAPDARNSKWSSPVLSTHRISSPWS
jgi:hypothetical protein